MFLLLRVYFIVSVRYKHGEDAERIRKRVRKKLTKALHLQPQQSNPRHVKRLHQFNANDIQQVATSSRYVVILLKDGRVARFQMSPTHEPGPHNGTTKSRPNSRTSFQVMSDEQYARQLQSMADWEGRGSPPSITSSLLWPHLHSPHPFDMNFDFPDSSVFGRPSEYPLLSHLPPGGEEDEFVPRLSSLWSPFGLSVNESGNAEEESQPQYERLDSGVSLDAMDTSENQRDGPSNSNSAAPRDGEFPSLPSFIVPTASDNLPGTSADPVQLLMQERDVFPLDSTVREKSDQAPQGRGREGHHIHRTGIAGSSGAAASAAYGECACACIVFPRVFSMSR